MSRARSSRKPRPISTPPTSSPWNRTPTSPTRLRSSSAMRRRTSSLRVVPINSDRSRVALRKAGYTGEFGMSDSFYHRRRAEELRKGTRRCARRFSDAATRARSLDRDDLHDYRSEVGAVTAFSAYGYAAAQLLILASQRRNRDQPVPAPRAVAAGRLLLVAGRAVFVQLRGRRDAAEHLPLHANRRRIQLLPSRLRERLRRLAARAATLRGASTRLQG